MWKTKPHGYWSEKLQSMAWSVSPPLPPPPSWWYLLLLLGDIWSFFHLEMLAPLALEYICYYLWISTAPTWWCLHFLIYRWYLPMLLCDICPCYLMIFAHATLWYLPCYLMIFASIVGFSSMWHAAAHQSSISRSVWYRGVVKFWFLVWATQWASHVQDQANAHNRSITHTDVQCSILFIQCTMFNVLWTLNFQF